MTPVQEVIKDAREKMEKALFAAKREFGTIRTGRASSTLVEGIHVDYYGVATPLKQLATISVPDVKLIIIHPWDQSCIKAVEKAISESPLGIMPSNDGKVIRISIPALSEERRQEFIKVTKKMAEDGRVSIRTVRRDAINHVRQLEKDAKATEDDRFNTEKELQELTDKYIKQVDEILKHKEQELLEV
ncbi:MAG: ribosome recycling factor [Candidatus Omnitrophota bacterium]